MRRKSRLRWRILRTGLLVVLLALAAARIIPRLISNHLKDEIFLRQDFTYAARYRVGGLEVGDRHFGGRSIDCVGLERPLPHVGTNILANPNLDSPCGWIFVPFLGGKEREGEARGGYFCIDDEEDTIFQEVRLHTLTDLADGGALGVTLAALLRPSRDTTEGSLSLSAEDGEGRRVGTLTVSPPGERSPTTGADWQPLSADWPVPPGTKMLRLTMHPGACFDDLSLTPRVFSRN